VVLGKQGLDFGVYALYKTSRLLNRTVDAVSRNIYRFFTSHQSRTSTCATLRRNSTDKFGNHWNRAHYLSQRASKTSTAVATFSFPKHPVMTTSWTPQSIDAYNKLRDERRRVHGLSPWNSLSAAAKRDSRDAEKARVLKDEISGLTTQAWTLDKYPTTSNYAAPCDGFLILPAAFSDGTGPTKVRRRNDFELLAHLPSTS
jgi:hypothetical protein